MRLPGDNVEIIDTIHEVAHALAGMNVFFRRGGIILFPSPTDPKMLPMMPLLFRAMIQEYVCFYKSVYNETLRTFVDVNRTLNSTDSQTIMDNPDFWKTLPEISLTHPCPLPILRDDGRVEMLPQGFDAPSGIYTF